MEEWSQHNQSKCPLASEVLAIPHAGMGKTFTFDVPHDRTICISREQIEAEATKSLGVAGEGVAKLMTAIVAVEYDLGE